MQRNKTKAKHLIVDCWKKKNPDCCERFKHKNKHLVVVKDQNTHKLIWNEKLELRTNLLKNKITSLEQR
jgi:hypothetical protein